MADAPQIPDEATVRAQWGNFAFTDANMARARELISHYPEGRQASAVMGLLDVAQRQVGAETNTQGWLPVPVIEYVAGILGMPYMRVFEVVTFYTMYNMAPVGRFHVQVCGTTPCMLRGSKDLIEVCKSRIHHDPFHVSADGNFSWEEVECLGACVNAPMVMIWKDTYEDLTAESFGKVLDGFASGNPPKPGSQTGRQFAAPAGGPTTLKTSGDAS